MSDEDHIRLSNQLESFALVFPVVRKNLREFFARVDRITEMYEKAFNLPRFDPKRQAKLQEARKTYGELREELIAGVVDLERAFQNVSARQSQRDSQPATVGDVIFGAVSLYLLNFMNAAIAFGKPWAGMRKIEVALYFQKTQLAYLNALMKHMTKPRLSVYNDQGTQPLPPTSPLHLNIVLAARR